MQPLADTEDYLSIERIPIMCSTSKKFLIIFLKLFDLNAFYINLFKYGCHFMKMNSYSEILAEDFCGFKRFLL